MKKYLTVDRFEQFLGNDFYHLKWKVAALLWMVPLILAIVLMVLAIVVNMVI